MHSSNHTWKRELKCIVLSGSKIFSHGLNLLRTSLLLMSQRYACSINHEFQSSNCMTTTITSYFSSKFMGPLNFHNFFYWNKCQTKGIQCLNAIHANKNKTCKQLI